MTKRYVSTGVLCAFECLILCALCFCVLVFFGFFMVLDEFIEMISGCLVVVFVLGCALGDALLGALVLFQCGLL